MTEPQANIAAVVVAIVSPFFGQYAIVLFAALAGALWPLSAASTSTRRDGALLLLRLVATSAALTGFVAWMLEQRLGFPASKAVAPVAFLIAWFGDAWRDPGAMVARATSLVKQIKGVFTGGAQ